jgi:two-component system, cell cycle response regulator
MRLRRWNSLSGLIYGGNGMCSSQLFFKLDLPIGAGIPTQTGTERRLNLGEFRRVLVAEGDNATRLNLQEMLCRWGFDVVLASHGVEALSVLRQKTPPDLVIVNKSLPGIDGIEICFRISDNASEYSPYILMLTNSKEDCAIVQALESGANDCLALPFEEQELRARLAVAVRILKRQDHLIRSRDMFRDQAAKDALTGLWSRRAILEILQAELSGADSNDRSTGILLLDLDRFKSVNDTHGHLAGDRVLQETAHRLSHVLRAYDSIGRYGGEEFLIVVPGPDGKELLDLAERIRAAIACVPVDSGESKIRVTSSIGAAIARPGEKSANCVIESADRALYRAKKAGRNRIMFCPQQPTVASETIRNRSIWTAWR